MRCKSQFLLSINCLVRAEWDASDVELPVGEQAVSSGSSELDADTAGADVIVDPVQPDLTVLRGMESILDFVGASTQWVVAGSVGAALVTRADAETLVWVVGSLFNAVFSKVLKKGINQVGVQLEFSLDVGAFLFHFCFWVLSAGVLGLVGSVSAVVFFIAAFSKPYLFARHPITTAC